MNARVGRNEAGEKVLRLHGSTFIADYTGALFWPDERLLLVADLHLEKGSCYASRRVFLPPYDTTATLARLASVVARFEPRRVVALGDSFHDGGGAGRLLAHDAAALLSIQTGRDWLWIAGNHDPAPPSTLQGDHALQWTVRDVCFRHLPSVASSQAGEIAGHLHPVAIVGGRAGTVRRRCFVADAMRCVMPAFGAYAGGLNFRDPAFSGLFGTGEPRVFVLGRDAVFTVAGHQCLVENHGLRLSWSDGVRRTQAGVSAGGRSQMEQSR